MVMLFGASSLVPDLWSAGHIGLVVSVRERGSAILEFIARMHDMNMGVMGMRPEKCYGVDILDTRLRIAKHLRAQCWFRAG